MPVVQQPALDERRETKDKRKGVRFFSFAFYQSDLVHELLGYLGCNCQIVPVTYLQVTSCATHAKPARHQRGYRAALAALLAQSSGDFLVTMDSFLATDPDFLLNIWAARERADLLIASRFAPRHFSSLTPIPDPSSLIPHP